MSDYDIFNGDADGLCALQQLRLAEPREAQLITGVKRDIALLERVEAGAGDRLTVLDISLDKNRGPLQRLLEAGAAVDYYDHHFAGEIPDHPGLSARIDTAADTCTSLIVNRQLRDAHPLWAVAGAFGDNFHDSARALGGRNGLNAAQLGVLERLGTCLNYNGYGVTLEDLHFAPDELFRALHPYRDPFDFVANEGAFQRLSDGFDADMASAAALQPQLTEAAIAIYLLPDEPWARRVSGVFGNDLARQYPARAHALLTELDGGAFRVSVRAPLENRQGADELCMRFPSGGGRKAAAGINRLEVGEYDRFVDAFRATYR